MVVNLVLEIPSSKKNAMILIAQLTVAGITGVIGHLVQKHVVKDPKIEEEKCKLVPEMGVHNVKVYRGRLKVAMLEIVQLIANGQVGQAMEVVANPVVQALKIFEEHGKFRLKMVVNLVLDLRPKENTAIPKIVHVYNAIFVVLAAETVKKKRDYRMQLRMEI